MRSGNTVGDFPCKVSNTMPCSFRRAKHLKSAGHYCFGERSVHRTQNHMALRLYFESECYLNNTDILDLNRSSRGCHYTFILTCVGSHGEFVKKTKQTWAERNTALFQFIYL